MSLLSAFRDYRESRRYTGEGYTLLDVKALTINRSGTPAPSMGPDGTISFGSNFNLWNQFWGQQGGSRINFASEVGDLHNSSLVMAAYNWIATNTASARLKVVELDGDNKETEVDGHPLIERWNEPNDYYGEDELIAGLSFDWLTAGTAYLLAVPTKGTNEIAELWWEPCSSIRPWWPDNGSTFIGGYEVKRDGKWQRIPPENVIVFRRGIDPDTRMGISPMQSLMREFYTDQQAAVFIAQLLRNGLVPPVVVGLGTKDTPFTGDVSAFKEDMKRKMSGATAGEPLVVTGPVAVEKLGFDYSGLGLREIRQIPEERFCAAIGISPHSLHFGTAREASTFGNVSSYIGQDYRSFIVPFQRYIAKTLRRRLLPFYVTNDRERITWDYTEVEWMQPDQTAEWERITNVYKSRILDQAEAREAIGYDFDDSHVGVYYPVPQTQVDASPLEPPPAPSVTPFNKPQAQIDDGTQDDVQQKMLPPDNFTQQDIQDAVDWWRLLAPPEARGLITAGTQE